MQHVRAQLPPDARSVPSARRALRELLDSVGASDDMVDAITLAASEVVTNAVVHTAGEVVVDAWAAPDGARVEVADTSPHLPAVRHYALTAGTGRGLRMLEQTVSRWGAVPRARGKVVWFEVGSPPTGHRGAPEADDASVVPSTGEAAVPAPTIPVTLQNVPLLMHWAWQEHAQTLMREHLLHELDTDPTVLDRHAAASDALNLLHEQVPVPRLPDDPDELLADALEPGVSAEEIRLEVPRGSVASFATLDSVLGRACEAAAAGLFLGPPTQPEIGEMREWLCDEVARQAGAGGHPRPWTPRSDARDPLRDRSALEAPYQRLAETDEPLLATDEASVIVAVSPSVAHFLGYASPADLVGRRVIAVVPARYHQAHIAGTTLNATNGRDTLLEVPITVPVVRADGTEVVVEICVRPQRLDDEHRVFVAHFTLPEPTDEAAGDRGQ